MCFLFTFPNICHLSFQHFLSAFPLPVTSLPLPAFYHELKSIPLVIYLPLALGVAFDALTDVIAGLSSEI